MDEENVVQEPEETTSGPEWKPALIMFGNAGPCKAWIKELPEETEESDEEQLDDGD